jgi:hypothetical protein
LWRRRGERYDDNCMMERNAWGGPRHHGMGWHRTQR